MYNSSVQFNCFFLRSEVHCFDMAVFYTYYLKAVCIYACGYKNVNKPDNCCLCPPYIYKESPNAILLLWK